MKAIYVYAAVMNPMFGLKDAYQDIIYFHARISKSDRSQEVHHLTTSRCFPASHTVKRPGSTPRDPDLSTMLHFASQNFTSPNKLKTCRRLQPLTLKTLFFN